MEKFAHAIHQLHSGALTRPQFLAQVDGVLAAASDGVGRLLEVLSEEHAQAPLPGELYIEVQRRIRQHGEARQRIGTEDTYLQTQPGANGATHTLPPDEQGEPQGASPERMKGVGDTLNGRFVLEECIGFGGMGTVYKALDLRKLEAADRKPYIAIKVLNVQFRGHPKSLIVLQREARKAQALAHPNIVAVYDFDRDGAMVYLTMEYLCGQPLSQMLRAPGFAGKPYAEVMRIVSGMGSALAYAHERGFAHCDFKPANVFLTDAGNVKVIDFGIARVFQKAEEDVDVTVFDPGSLGALTPAYASPEMLEHLDPDPRDDIYALACITYELLTGRHPYNRLSALQARAAGMHPQRPTNLSRTRWRALRAALALERAARTPTVGRFLSQFGEAGRGKRGIWWAGAGVGVATIAGLALVAAFKWWPASGTAGSQTAAAPPAAEPSAAAPPATAPPATAPLAAAPRAAVAPANVGSKRSAPVEAAPSADKVEAALGAVPCSALVAAINARALWVQGYVSKAEGPARLKDTLAALPGVGAVSLDVQQVEPDKCAIISAFAPYWIAHRRAGGGAAIRLAASGGAPGTVLTEGDSLMVDVTTPGAQSYVTLDYYSLDGNVVHLLPNPRARDNRAPANYTATIGSMGEWAIGKPFGSELLVLVTTPAPLFDTLRPVSESAADYVAAVTKQLEKAAAPNGAGKISVAFLQISTKPRKR